MGESMEYSIWQGKCTDEEFKEIREYIRKIRDPENGICDECDEVIIFSGWRGGGRDVFETMHEYFKDFGKNTYFKCEFEARWIEHNPITHWELDDKGKVVNQYE